MAEAFAFKEISKRSKAPKAPRAVRLARTRKAPAYASLSASFDERQNIVISDLAGRAKKEETVVVVEKKPPSFGEVMQKASQKAFRGGVAGFCAGVVQVGSFMWMRTAMNYQYANGGTMVSSIKTLYAEGGIPRFYKGVAFAIFQNPLSRFGDTAANAGVIAVIDAYFPQLPVAAKTGFSTMGGATWRIFLTPIDTMKTTLQVQGSAAFKVLMDKIKVGGIGVMYSGMFANFAANWVGQYPWFATYNYLDANLPKQTGKMKYVRSAAVGICASGVSDCVSNSLRVIKTVKQTNPDANLSYVNAVKGVVAKDGIAGLFGRGLKTRLITNMAQSMVFSVIWKSMEEELNKEKPKKVEAAKK